VFLLTQQTPVPAAVAAPVQVAQARPAARKAAPAPAPVVAPAPPAAAPRAARPAPAPTPAPQHYWFDNDQVEGELQNPDVIGIVGTVKVKHSSLIEIPGSFVLSVAKSIEDL
jgi:hypothetical protein